MFISAPFGILLLGSEQLKDSFYAFLIILLPQRANCIYRSSYFLLTLLKHISLYKRLKGIIALFDAVFPQLEIDN